MRRDEEEAPWLHFRRLRRRSGTAKDHVRKIKDKNAEMIKLKAKLEAAPKKLGKELANATGREKRFARQVEYLGEKPQNDRGSG